MPKKEFKTLDQQITLLQDRGLVIDNIDKAKKYLLSNNYYNLINGYGKFFQDKENHFKKNTSFDEIYELYFVDKEIKQAIFDSILNVEHHLKSILAYRFAEKYSDKRYAYLDINSYSSEKTLKVSYTLSKLFRIINQNSKKVGTPINHYVRVYDDVPIWVIVDYLDFGDLYSIIFNLPTNLQNNIALDLVEFIKQNIPGYNEIFTPELMISMIKNIHEIRNVCAHNNRLIDFKCKSDIIYSKQIFATFGIKKNDDRKRAYSTFVSLQAFLSQVEFPILNNTLRKRFRFLSNKLSTISIGDVLSKYGFPEDWHQRDAIKQN